MENDFHSLNQENISARGIRELNIEKVEFEL